MIFAKAPVRNVFYFNDKQASIVSVNNVGTILRSGHRSCYMILLHFSLEKHYKALGEPLSLF